MTAWVLALVLAAGDGEGDGPPFELRSALKSTGLVTQQRGSAPGPRDGAVTAWRLRFEPRAQLLDWLSLEAAYDVNVQLETESGFFVPGLGVTAPVGVWRWTPLEWTFGGGAYAGVHQLDRLAVDLTVSRVHLVVGRQAIGFGRGVLFSAVDVFSPFTPLQIDREWRRGLDAARVDVRLTDKISIDGTLVRSSTWDASAAVGRARGYFGLVDVELLGGWRAGDGFVGLSSSGAVKGAEVHGEVAAFRPKGPGPWVWKGVAGVSYDFRLWRGLNVVVEYHYSGFGLNPPADLTTLGGGDFLTRLSRGDMQILGQHAAAVVASTDVSDDARVSLTGLVDPSDGSGLAAPAVVWDFSERASVEAGAYMAWGRGLEGTMLFTQFGATPFTVFAQLRLYDSRRVERR